MKENNYLQSLISLGENQQMDFKYNISDSRKIAKTFVAFTNTNGGKILVGVKDNGRIAGIISDEEIYMLEAASEMYCKPRIPFTVKEWKVDNKTVLEVSIPISDNKPYYALNENDKWLAYIRFQDNNILANRIMIKVWKRKKRKKGTYLNYSKKEQILLNFLENNESITLKEFCKIARVPKFRAENILVNLISLDVIKIIISTTEFSYSLVR